MEGFKEYWTKIYDLRYFCIHLVKIDLKNKFRRSKLGILWTVVYPLGLSLIIGTVFAVVFHQEILSYLPYVLSGILFWDLVSGSFNSGGYSLIGYDCFIRQCNHPLTLYTMKHALVTVIVFTISLISLCLWVVFINPLNLLLGIISLPFTIILFFFFSWAGTTIAGYTCAQYRDYPMIAPLVLQVVWYISPVFLKQELFMNNNVFKTWFTINPITHMLNLIRNPFLYGCFPNWIDYLVTVLFVAVLGLIAYEINKNKKRNLIFYL